MRALRPLIRKSAGGLLEVIAPGFMHDRKLRLAGTPEKQLELLPALCEKGRLAIDVRANKGLYVDHLRALGADVVAFEPHPRMARQLRRFYRGGVDVQNVALSDRPGRAQLRLPKDNVSWATLAETNRLDMADPARGFESVDVEVRTLDEYQFQNVIFIKIDVAGHEEAVLRGARDTISASHPCLLIEIEERHNAGSIARVAKMLQELAYRLYFLFEDTLHPYHDFAIAKHQLVSNVDESGKRGTYINNFVFVHKTRVEEVLAKMPIKTVFKTPPPYGASRT
jgi:FkbM family methyltransferase